MFIWFSTFFNFIVWCPPALYSIIIVPKRDKEEAFISSIYPAISGSGKQHHHHLPTDRRPSLPLLSSSSSTFCTAMLLLNLNTHLPLTNTRRRIFFSLSGSLPARIFFYLFIRNPPAFIPILTEQPHRHEHEFIDSVADRVSQPDTQEPRNRRGRD